MKNIFSSPQDADLQKFSKEITAKLTGILGNTAHISYTLDQILREIRSQQIDQNLQDQTDSFYDRPDLEDK